MPLREILAKFGFDVDTKALENAKLGIDSVAKSVGGLTGLFGGLAAAAGFGLIKGQIDELAAEAGSLRAAAVKAGTGFQEFQKLQYETGLSTESLTTLFRKLQQNVAAAGGAADAAASDFQDIGSGIEKALGKKQAAATFEALGVEIKTAGGEAKSNAKLFEESTQALAKLKDPAQRTALAMRLFGRAGADIIPFLNKGPEAIAALGEQFDLFGGITDDANEKLKAYSGEQKKLGFALRSLKVGILSELVPAFTYLATKLNEGITWIKKNTTAFESLKIGVVVVTAAIVAMNAASVSAAAAAFAGWLKAALPIVALFLIFDDLYHFLVGDAHTAIERFIVALYGAEEGEQIILGIRAAFKDFIQVISEAPEILDKILIILKGIGVAILDIVSKVQGGLLKALGFEKLGNQVSGQVDTYLREAADKKYAADQALRKRAQGTGVNFAGALNGPGGVTLAPVEIQAPRVPGAAGPKGPTTNTVNQNVHIVQNVIGSDAKEVADNATTGIKTALGDERRATQAALQARK